MHYNDEKSKKQHRKKKLNEDGKRIVIDEIIKRNKRINNN